MKRLVKSAQFALLLLRLGIAQRMFEELAEQRDDQAGLEEVDEGRGITGCLLADGALQEFLRPEGVASELLRAVDGDRVASRGSSVVPGPLRLLYDWPGRASPRPLVSPSHCQPAAR